MSASKLANVTSQIKTFWSDMAMNELRQTMLLGSLINTTYSADLKEQGDTVKVYQINAPQGELRTVGTDADAFSTDTLSTSTISIQATKRAVAAYEFENLMQLQSQIDVEMNGGPASPIRQALIFAVQKKVNDYLYSLVAPIQAAPDHLINSTATFDATALGNCRQRAAIAKWGRDKPWYIMCDPVYYQNLLAAQTLTSRDYTGQNDVPIIAGQIVNNRFGFSILEDNGISTSQALVFHPDFLCMVMQQAMNFKVSDLHPNKKFGFVVSADIVFGASLGIQGSTRHQVVCADGSATGIVTI